MATRVIENVDMAKPFGPYSQAVAASGELVFCFGQAGIDPLTGQAPAEFGRQARFAFENLSRTVRASGLTMKDVAKTTVYLTDASQFEALNELFGEFFPTLPPTRTVPIVQLAKGLLISIEAIAVRP